MWNVVGHSRNIRALELFLHEGGVPQALLFTGPSGIGKTHAALELAKALNCTGVDPPCQLCIHCRQIELASHPDVVTIQRPDGKDSIAIQQVRELRESASLRPFQGVKKVYIVAGAEALTPQACDALLKTLEEPHLDVVVILTAPDADTLPETVVSRCRVLYFQPLTGEEVNSALQERGAPFEEGERLARLAQGNFGWALRALKQPQLADQHEEILTKLTTLMDMPLDERLQFVEAVSNDRKDRAALRRNLELLLLVARDLLLESQGCRSQLLVGEQRELLARQGARFSLAQIHEYLDNVRLALLRIEQNVDPRLALEALLVKL